LPAVVHPARSQTPPETPTQTPPQTPIQTPVLTPAGPKAAGAVNPSIASEKPAAAAKKKRSAWPFILGGIGVLLACLLALGTAARISENQRGTQTAAVDYQSQAPAQDGTSTPAPLTPEGVPPDAFKAMTLALENWRKGATDDAYTANIQAIETLEDNPAYTTAAVNYYTKEEGWVLAAMVGADYFRRHPNEFTPEQLQRLHEALYRAAGDANAKQFFADFAENPVFLAAEMRYRLYFDGGGEKIQKDLEKSLKQPITLRRFPELKLLEAETLIAQGNLQRARDAQSNLLKDRSLPSWVQDLTRELDAKLK
jgi:hypothetical protein